MTTLVSTPTTEVEYLSRRDDLRLTKTARYPMRGPSGEFVGWTDGGQVVRFQDGVLRVPRDGDFTLEDNRKVPGAEVIEWLERHPMFGNQNEGFWRLEQPAPPITEQEQEMLMEATLDEDLARRIYQEEEQGWARPAILNPLRRAIERIEEMKASIAAEEQEKAKRGAKS